MATARIALAAIRHRARREGGPRPDGALTAKVLAGYGRAGANPGRGQVAGVTWEQADAMAALAAEDGSLRGLRDAALIAVMSDALLRISEAAAEIYSGPLFRRIRKGGRVEATALTAKSIREVIRCWAKAAGVAGRLSGHSLRIGSAQSLVSAGATLPELQQAGRWLSPSVPAHYARGQFAGRGAVARLRPDSPDDGASGPESGGVRSMRSSRSRRYAK